ncbi:flagellin domain protein [Magnetococcus marinus MC-1]|uniref:Flagellin n=1 Tax=Magnetococcus marinus (strain ATCC BAA-1437 / JCM 17883 / MC-1) TaxID=156889 RepID=A0L3R8_MAGMM|nr:flagellin [Magnetococcus marinus]ABK42611.1 flagellin domain protein [Magnetococcus marinus MC-1]
MALYINTNVASLNAQRNLSNSTGKLGTTFSRLASGLRINSARDDAAGLAITQRMTAQIRGLNQAIRNANDGISVSQVAEGALDETTNALQRIRELAVQSANAIYNSSDRLNLDKEVDQMLAEVQRISVDTEFNKLNVLDGTYTGQAIQVGAFASQTITISIAGAQLSHLGITNVTISTAAGATAALSLIDLALDSIADVRANLGAIQSRFGAVTANLSNIVENMSASRSRIQDADIAAETATLTKNAILQQAGTAVLAQANQQPQLALQLLG